MAAGPTHLAVGLLKKPHGLQGDVIVYPLTDQPGRVFEPGRRLAVLTKEGVPTGRELLVKKSRPHGRAWLLHLEGFDDRNALDALRDVFLAIEIGQARPLAEGEFFLHELVGLDVQTADKTPVGQVTEVLEAPQGLLLVVKGDKEHLIPFRAGIVRRVDRAAKMVTVTPPEGLLEL